MPADFSAANYLEKLTESQREAVLHSDGPLLILAGPGSGKTRVITCRVMHLLQQGVKPWQILAITFTNKAAQEMRNRLEAMGQGRGVWISTFHSLGVRLLRQYADRLNLDRNFVIYDQADRLRMTKKALELCNIDNVRFREESIQAAISKAKNQLLSPGQFAKTAKDFFTTVVAQVYVAYEKKMRDAAALDFDDLLYWPALALRNDEEMRAELDARFRYVLIDEYQDTNQAQYAIAHALAIDYPNLCVVGDPDQSIYKWRGANIRNILDFEKDYPSARVITLGENFRSTKAILKAADQVIGHNVQRKAKPLFTANADGVPVHVLQFETGLDEAEQVAVRIKQAVEQGGRRYRDFALFMRMNALSRNLEVAFIHARIPFQIVRGLAFFERKENKDVLAYLRLLLNPKDDISFLRAVNEPARGIGKTSLEHLATYAEPRDLSLLAAAMDVDKIPAIKGKASAGLKAFVILMAELRVLSDAPPDEVIRQVLDRSGYRKMLKMSDDEEDEERLANIEELITAAKQFHQEDTSRTLADFLENITLASDVDGWDETQDCVSVMTLHAAKGLEFPVVYILANEQGILPHERSMGKEEDVEEERRLTFVGMTRAKEELFLTHSRMREFRGQTLYAVPSMFLDELPEEGIERVDLSQSGAGRKKAMDYWRSASASWLDSGIPLQSTKGKDSERPPLDVDYEEGMFVEHEAYGRGQVTQVSGHGVLRKVKIRFRKAGERTFLANKAKLKIVQQA
jgi:DNA helicase-2/ATP-dependent DNA helicase PcrA